MYLLTFSLLSFFYCNMSLSFFLFFFNDTATTEIYTLSLHDALPICPVRAWSVLRSHALSQQIHFARQRAAGIAAGLPAPRAAGLGRGRRHGRAHGGRRIPGAGTRRARLDHRAACRPLGAVRMRTGGE